MFCKNCGKHITDSAKFCPFCGAGTVATVGFSPPAPRESEQTMTRVTGGMKYMAFSIMWRVLVLIEGFVLIPCAVKYFQALSGSKWALALLSASDSGAEIAAFLSAPPFIALAAVLIVFLGMISSGFGGEMLGLAIMWITAWVCGVWQHLFGYKDVSVVFAVSCSDGFDSSVFCGTSQAKYRQNGACK